MNPNFPQLVMLLLVATATLPAAMAAAETDSSATWISVTPTGLAYAGPANEITLDVMLDGQTIATAARTFDGARAPTSLTSLVAETRYEGKLTDHELGMFLRRGDERLLEIRGQPTMTNNVLALRVTSVQYPSASPITPTGSVVFLVEHGWNDETLTVGFAWKETPRGRITVLLEADGDGTSIRDQSNATLVNGTAWKADFHLDRLPSILTWKATILLDDVPAGVTGSTIAFPTRTARDGYFTPTPGSMLVAAGGFHEVGGHKQTISIDRGVLAPIFEGSSDCPAKGAYDTVNGETWRIASLASRASTCDKTIPNPPDETMAPAGSDTIAAATTEKTMSLDPFLVAKILAAVLAALLVVYVVVARHRRTP